MMAPLIGALPEEITHTSGLTENIHKVVSTLYKPKGKKNKIVTIQKEFASDLYAIQSQIELKGLSYQECQIAVPVDQLDSEKATQQIIDTIEKNRDEIALVWFSMVNYLTSTKFNVPEIVKVCHKYDIKCCVDLAHAAGSIPVSLHDWNVDGAVWCSYKYINSGPGCLGGLFMHKNNSHILPGLRGWHGNSRSTQFLMQPNFEPEQDARKFQISNFDPGQAARVEAGLQLFHKAGGIHPIRERNVQLTDYLFDKLKGMPKLKIVSPFNHEERGSHVSIIVENTDMQQFKQQLLEHGICADLRKFENDTYLMRISPVGLYITYEDLDALADTLEFILKGNESHNKV